MDQMEKTIRPMVTDALPPGDYREKLVDLFFEKFRSTRQPDELANLVVPIYDKYYSDEDIRGLIQLYQTPLGKKMLSTLPQVMAESQAAGTKWGEQIGRESMMEVLTEHPELQKADGGGNKTVSPKLPSLNVSWPFFRARISRRGKSRAASSTNKFPVHGRRSI